MKNGSNNKLHKTSLESRKELNRQSFFLCFFFFSYLFFDPFNFFNFLLFMRFMAQIEEVKKKDLRENSALVIAFLFSSKYLGC